jgi:uroporphyrinogen decarboxylase
VDAALAQLRQLHDAVGAYCCMLGIADDMGDKRGITIGPQRWRSVYKPHYKRLFDGWHRITNMKINLHTCGSMFEILEDLVECGVDLYNPVQVSAEGMDPAGLKQRFGDRLIFYGGAFDAAGIPPSASAETAYEAAKANIRALSRGGGYLFAGVHNLPGNLPEAHLQALMTAYRDCRDEPACRAPEWRRPDEVRPQPVRDSHDQAVG